MTATDSELVWPRMDKIFNFALLILPSLNPEIIVSMTYLQGQGIVPKSNIVLSIWLTGCEKLYLVIYDLLTKEVKRVLKQDM
jgi:hypothetical protein